MQKTHEHFEARDVWLRKMKGVLQEVIPKPALFSYATHTHISDTHLITGTKYYKLSSFHRPSKKKCEIDRDVTES